MKKPIRVLQLAGGMNAGGMETLIMSVYRRIDRGAVQFDFLYGASGSYFYDAEIEDLGGRIMRVPVSRKRPFASWRGLLDFYGKSGYQVAHHHFGNLRSVLGLSACARAGVPTRIMHAHSAGGRPAGPKARADRTAHLLNRRFRLGLATDHFACSEEAAGWFGYGGLSGYRILANGVDLDRFAFDAGKRLEARRELGISQDAFCVGEVARLAPVKNHAFAMGVFSELVAVRPDSVFVLAGTGPLEGELRAQAAALGVADKVLFLGDRGDADALLCAFDAFVFPSVREGLGLALVEAQASGLPCFASLGVPEAAVVCGNARRLPTSGNERQWAQALAGVRVGERNPVARAEVARAGYDIGKTAKWLEAFYLERHEAALRGTAYDNR